MAIILDQRYPGRVNPSTTNYPTGSYKNETSQGSNDGTPLEQDQANDWQGFTDALLSAGNVMASGLPDTALVSDRMTALMAIINEADRSVPTDLPTSPIGLNPGDLWRDGTVINVVVI